MDKKPQLSEEQRQQIRAIVKTQVRDMLGRGEELKAQASTARQVWQALVDAPTWTIRHLEKPDDLTTMDEIWSMTPTVKKQ